MATRRQRSRKYARRVHHGHAQRERLRAALYTVPQRIGSMDEMREHMHERGYEQDMTTGKWRRVRGRPTELAPRRGPSWRGIFSVRRRKAQR